MLVSEKEAQYSFKPAINLTSEIICESDPQRQQADQVQRLYQQDMQKKEVYREIKENEIYGSYTFQPKINKVSKTLASDYRTELIQENMSNPAAKEKFRQKQDKYIREKQSEYTFQPNLETKKNRAYENVPSTLGGEGEQFSQNLKKRLKEKQQKIAAERRQREMEELDECTFKPRTNPEIMDNGSEVVVVRGLGRHLELQELKKKQEEERKLRELEVFGVNHKFAINAADYDINNPKRYELMASNSGYLQSTAAAAALPTTVPQPFNLSSNEQFGKIRKEKLIMEIRQ